MEYNVFDIERRIIHQAENAAAGNVILFSAAADHTAHIVFVCKLIVGRSNADVSALNAAAQSVNVVENAACEREVPDRIRIACAGHPRIVEKPKPGSFIKIDIPLVILMAILEIAHMQSDLFIVTLELMNIERKITIAVIVFRRERSNVYRADAAEAGGDVAIACQRDIDAGRAVRDRKRTESEAARIIRRVSPQDIRDLVAVGRILVIQRLGVVWQARGIGRADA